MSKVLGQKATVQRIKRKVDAVQGVLDESGLKRLLLARMQGRFLQTVAPSGKPWPSLDPDTIRKKKQKGSAEPERPLWDSGRLYNALQIIRGSSAGLFSASTGAGFRIGITDIKRSSRKGGLSPVEYGRIQNYGYGVPERRFIGLSASDIDSVSRYLARRMKSIAKV